MATTVRIRRILPGEALALRELRLRALAGSPRAFGSRLADEAAFPEAVWRERATLGAVSEEHITFIAEREGRWIGLGTGLADAADEPDPILVGMFVAPEERGRGIGKQIVDAVTDWARSRGARQLALWVTTTNVPAIRLYERCGFRPTGEVRDRAHTPRIEEMRMVQVLHDGASCGFRKF